MEGPNSLQRSCRIRVIDRGQGVSRGTGSKSPKKVCMIVDGSKEKLKNRPTGLGVHFFSEVRHVDQVKLRWHLRRSECSLQPWFPQ